MKIKKLLSLIAAATMAVTALTGAMTASASEVATGECGDLTWTLDSDGKLTISGEGAMATPDPSSIPGGEERKGDYADTYTYKEYSKDIKEVIIEEGVTTMGFCAFYKMPSIQTVVIPSTIEEFIGVQLSPNTGGDDIANYAFAECTSLENLTLTEGMKDLGGYAFYGCKSLESVTIPKSLKKWSQNTFAECSKLTNVTLTEGLTLMTGSAFRNSGIRSIVIPASIERWASTNYTNKEAPVLHPIYTNYAFADCTKLSSVTFEEGLKSIGPSAFMNCSSLKKVYIPSSVNDLDHSFYSCTGLQEVYIEEGVQIPNGNDNFQNAFAYCENLKNIEVASGIDITYTNARWIYNCSLLQNIYIHGKDYTMYIPDGNGTAKFHCYFDTDTYNKALIGKGQIPSDRLINIEDTLASAKDTLKTKLEDAKALNENDYTAESYAALKTAIENAEKFDESYTGVLPLQWAASDITSATRKLEEKPQPADYTAVDEALAKIPSDLSIYTDETVKALNDAKEAVVRDLTIDEQERVNGFANAIEEAIAGLKKKQNSNTGSGDNNNPQNPNQNTNKPNQPTSSKDKGKTPTNKVTVPKPAQVKSVKATVKKKKLNVSWKKVSGATGYEVLYATNNKFTKGKKTVKVKKNKVTLKKLKAKKKYFVKVRAYKKVKGNVSYGKWSKVVKKKTK